MSSYITLTQRVSAKPSDILDDNCEVDLANLLQILQVTSEDTFRCEVIRNFALLRLEGNTQFLPAHRILTAKRHNVWQWVVPCLEQLLSTPFHAHKDSEYSHMLEVGSWFIRALSDERSWIELSSRSIFATASKRVCAVSCVTKRQCDIAWSTWWSHMWRFKLDQDDLSSDDALADLIGGETHPKNLCEACFTLSLAKLMQKVDWSPLQPSRIIRESAIRLRDTFRQKNGHLGPPKPRADVTGDSVIVYATTLFTHGYYDYHLQF